MLANLPESKLVEYLRHLPDGFHLEEADVREAISSREAFASFQTLCVPSLFRVDNFVANSNWDQEQLRRARSLPVFHTSVPFASPEDTIVAKCRWFDLGNRVSDRQWNDLMRLYEVQRENLDVPYIERWLSEFGLMDLWVEIQRQAKA